ncbi:MAG: hypothetical protein AAF998_10545 [Bacteroidota bacterium]
MKARKWRIYSAPYQLNIVGIRSPFTRAGKFDDLLTVFYKDERGKWHFHAWAATLDPGLHYLHLPLHHMGAAILAEGQYVDAYAVDRHRGKYYALCQRRAPVTVIRDYNRDDVLDFQNGKRMSGMYGINIHRTSYFNGTQGPEKAVRRDSAGCTVLREADDFNKGLMPLVETHKRLHGNVFTYSVLDFRAMQRRTRRKWIVRGGLLALAGIGAYLLLSNN